jgi:hypothetical protein
MPYKASPTMKVFPRKGSAQHRKIAITIFNNMTDGGKRKGRAEEADAFKC